MFFFIAGLQQKTAVLESETGVCPCCGGRTALSRARTDTWFSVFFIPLFRVKKGETYSVCGACGYGAGSIESAGNNTGRAGYPMCPACGKTCSPAYSYCPYCGRKIP